MAVRRRIDVPQALEELDPDEELRLNRLLPSRLLSLALF